MLYNLVTGVLMMFVINAGTTLLDLRARSRRCFPWLAVALTLLLVGGLLLQTFWGGAMAALDADPARSGWWRPVTAVFLQNSGLIGDTFNLVTLAVIAALAEWQWGRALAAVLFLAGALVPHALDRLAGLGRSSDPRNFAGSSGATFFLGATLAGALLVAARDLRHRMLALVVPALGLATWFVQANGHGLVAGEGFVLGALGWVIVSRRRRGSRG